MNKDKLIKLEEILNQYNFERQDVVHGTILALISKQNILYLGEPGIAKTQLALQLTKLIEGANIFQYLMTKYTLPEELFGPISLKHLKEDKLVRVSEGTVQNSSIIFLDEIFKSNSSILNTLLTLLNEKIYYEGGKPKKAPLILCIGASNEIPDENDGLQALQDRFVLKYLINKIKEKSNFEKMMFLDEKVVDGDKIINDDIINLEPIISLDEIQSISNEIKNIKIHRDVFDCIFEIRKLLENNNIFVTDRTFKLSLSILKAEAYLNNKDIVEYTDLIILKNILWNNPKDSKKVYYYILEVIDPVSTQITALYQHAQKLYESFIDEKNKETKLMKGIETANNLRDIRKKIIGLSKSSINNKINIIEHNNLINSIDNFLQNIHEGIAGSVNIDLSNLK
ncbi:MAG: AAA family ATPase [Spirochaetes bacterium]|nr:AAA family ATPase [Spirochaetota bacterium]